MTPFNPHERLLDSAGGRRGFLFEKKIGLGGQLMFERTGDLAFLGLLAEDKIKGFVNWDEEITVGTNSLTAQYDSLGRCVVLTVDLGEFVGEVAKQENDNEVFLRDDEEIMKNLDETQKLFLGVTFNQDGSSELSITRWEGFPGPKLTEVELFRTNFPKVSESIAWRGKIQDLSSDVAVAMTADLVKVALIAGNKIFIHLANRKINTEIFDQAKKVGVVDERLAEELIKAALPTSD